MSRPFPLSVVCVCLFSGLLPGRVVGVDDAQFSAVEHTRQTIYHSPQTPGFTSWVGAWTMPDGSLMVCFTQATGPLKGRPQAPPEVRRKLTWPPAGRPGYDMTGLDLRNVHLRSTDGGKTWAQVSADPFKTCMNGITGEAQTALPDGTIVRGVFGSYLPYNPELPKTGYLERSTDGSRTWGEPEVLLPELKYAVWPKRFRVLRDGRLIVLGGVAPFPANSRTRTGYSRLIEPLLMVSSDQGRSWEGLIPVVPMEHRRNWGGEEFDAAELANGDLLCVFRRIDPSSGRSVRWQGLLKKTADSWVPAEVRPAPFPHSGHPDVLATREGPVLHLATTGIDWTTDAGRTWKKFRLPGTRYYPRAVQTEDGRILVFAHVGGDDAYGKTDQSIVMDAFRLVKQKTPPEQPVGNTNHTEILTITRHPPTKLSPLRNQNTSSLSVSSTGVVAAYYGYDGAPKFFRTSTDGGLTWGPEHPSPPEMGGGQASGTLRKGGSIRPVGMGQPIDGEPGWYLVDLVHFTDDFSAHVIKPARIYMPGAITKRVEGRSYVWYWPNFHSSIETLIGGDLIAVMYGLFEGDAVGSDRGCRVIVVRSNDQGQTWRYQGTVSNEHQDPNPELPGMFAGFTESSIAQLVGGKLLCMLRSQGSHLPSEYRPLYVSWSEDLGKTWTTPVPTQPHLMNILPTLVTLDNGVVAAVYGRPGVHVAFSTDDGHSWSNRISFSHLKVGMVTGQVDGRQVAPHRLAVVGGIDRGTWLFPISVERQRVSPAQTTLSGRVLDDRGKAVAGAQVQRSPNRYTADTWNIVPADRGLPGYYHESFFDNKMMPDTPRLGYRAIRPENESATVTTDRAGRFRFTDVKLGEWVLTVESDGFAPQHRRVHHLPNAKPHEFQLEPGRGVRGRIVDPQGRPVAAACVVLGLFHCHTDERGRFAWSLTKPVPTEVPVKVYKRYSRRYTVLQRVMSLVEIERQPIILKLK